MNTQDTFTFMQTWGYYLEPKPHRFSPGHPGLTVAIRARPTHQHFDPETITLCLLTPNGVERAHLGMQLHGLSTRRVCPGRVTLTDRYSKRTDFYTYGAELSVIGSKDETIYRFTSSAPILWMAEGDTDFPEQLEAETEAILASIHAQWLRQDALFARRLVDIEPLDLYLAALRSIDDRYAQCSALRDSFHPFYDSLQHEIGWQRTMGNLPVDGPRLETLLPAPNGVV